MKIEKDKVVSLIYELRENNADGRIIEALDEEKPMTFIFGTGRLLPDFESKLLSLEKDDVFSFTLDSETAYGERREELIIDVPISAFENEGKLDENICRIGNEVPMMDKDGNHLSGVINEISDTFVKMDFNHPMAGTDLCFKGKIIDVRQATEGELNSLQNSCSTCGSHSHDNGCSGGCN
jgi:FKBP-type peptidyl-prolyl cis-trans isomerase SlyD